MTKGDFMKFKLGCTVKVVNPKLQTYGMYGKIDKKLNYWFTDRSLSAYVCLDDGRTLYYNLKNLKVIDENNKEENETMFITGDFNVVKVKFLNGTNTNTEYEYAIFEPFYNVGDTVVVASAHHGLGIAKITALVNRDEALTKHFEREVVAKINMAPYEKRKQNRAKLQELNNKMEKRVQELNKLAIFEMMAEKDESLKEMLAEYKELIG